MSLYATDWEYTPEPRRYGGGTHHLVGGLTADGRRIDLVEIERDLCDDFRARLSDDDAAKIARLIAAAPDLLDACKALADFLYRDDARPLDAIFVAELARAAIAKAEGSE